MIDGAASLHFVGNEIVLFVEEENAELLTMIEPLHEAQIVEHPGPRRQRWLRCDLPARQPFSRRLDQLQLIDGAVANAVYFF